jgi:quinohemoprotein ethanol dehydrogenase
MKLPMRLLPLSSLLLLASLAACNSGSKNPAETPAKEAAAAAVANVDEARLKAADSEPGSWMSSGRTYDEQRYSPLEASDQRRQRRRGWASRGSAELDRSTAGSRPRRSSIDGVLYNDRARIRS